MTTFDRLAESELLSSSWDIGYTYGLERTPEARMLASLAHALGRAVTAEERARLVAGWECGLADAATHAADMAARVDVPATRFRSE